MKKIPTMFNRSYRDERVMDILQGEGICSNERNSKSGR
jgi:hypothetical protein